MKKRKSSLDCVTCMKTEIKHHQINRKSWDLLRNTKSTHHKACFSNLAITQQTDLQGHQIWIRLIPTRRHGGFIQSQTRLYWLRRRKRTPARQAPVLACLSCGTDKNPIPNESKKLSNKRDPLEYAPPDVDVNNFPAKLWHVSSSFLNKLGHQGGCRYLVIVFSLSLRCFGTFGLLN